VSGDPDEPREPRPPSEPRQPSAAGRPVFEPESRPPGRLERLAEVLPRAARQLGLDEELELATAMRAWQAVVSERVPAAARSCRLVSLSGGLATVEADEPIVAQELRLRTPELLAALRAAMAAPVRQLRVTPRHV
jgi:predicted nucleic acid-binding Zn ribbon protein